jgi:hypothetical protein
LPLWGGGKDGWTTIQSMVNAWSDCESKYASGFLTGLVAEKLSKIINKIKIKVYYV